MAEPCHFDSERDVNNQHGRDIDMVMSRKNTAELRETLRECNCCLEQPESENKFTQGTHTFSVFISYKQK